MFHNIDKKIIYKYSESIIFWHRALEADIFRGSNYIHKKKWINHKDKRQTCNQFVPITYVFLSHYFHTLLQSVCIWLKYMLCLKVEMYDRNPTIHLFNYIVFSLYSNTQCTPIVSCCLPDWAQILLNLIKQSFDLFIAILQTTKDVMLSVLKP